MTKADRFELNSLKVWDTESAFQQLKESGQCKNKRAAERRLHEMGILPPALSSANLNDEEGIFPTQIVLAFDIDRQRAKRRLVLFAQLFRTDETIVSLHANDARGARYWIQISGDVTEQSVLAAAKKLQEYIAKPIAIFPHGDLVRLMREMKCPPDILVCLLSYRPPINSPAHHIARTTKTPHLDRLEAEGISIIREAVAEANNPVLLYSIGKDSTVLLHLARKAFLPAKPPFPLLHVDTQWKFQAMYQFRDKISKESGMDLLIHINPEAIEKAINPFDHGAALHTNITKTEGLKQALDIYKFDMIFGGARRDEEKSRAKERIFSFRSRNHNWDPKNQRPELWNLYNTRKAPGESIRVFPLSNWTELDVWQYIFQEQIPVVPLYFAMNRPVVIRDGMILAIDDDRMKLMPGEEILVRKVRFRTLGCYPLTGAIESEANSVEEIIVELLQANTSERQGRLIDSGSPASMEKKKLEGYF